MTDANRVNQIETKNINKIIGVEGKNIFKIGKIPVSFAKIPTGLIIFFNSESIPSGWESYENTNDKMIVGAGSTYSPGDNGLGDIDKAVGISTSTVGNHAPATLTSFTLASADFDGGSDQFTADVSRGSHSHALSNLNYIPPKNKYRLIKSLGDYSSFPVNSILLSNTSLGITNISVGQRFMAGSSSISIQSESATIDLSSAGNHNHRTGTGSRQHAPAGSYTAVLDMINNGLHYQTANSINVTENIKHFMLSLWTSASSQFDTENNMIAMWESLTPPDGWVLCDGQNGTPDLRDCFIKTVDSGNESGPSGDGTITINGQSLSHSASHLHGYQPNNPNGGNYINHPTYSWSHSHSVIETTGISWLPPYYTLSFVMKTD